jgi:hypothetical protein
MTVVDQFQACFYLSIGLLLFLMFKPFEIFSIIKFANIVKSLEKIGDITKRTCK